MIGTNRYIGSPVERIEDARFLRGRGQFVGDLKREGMLHAAILRSPSPTAAWPPSTPAPRLRSQGCAP